MHWSSAYVGLPFVEHGRDRAGVDCWGLVRLIYAEVRGIDLPGYGEAYVTTAERREIAAAMDGARGLPPWRRVERAGEWDVVMFSVAGLPVHVGIVTAPGRMLHISRGISSRIEPYAGGTWSPRLVGIYRHTEIG